MQWGRGFFFGGGDYILGEGDGSNFGTRYVHARYLVILSHVNRRRIISCACDVS